MDKLKFKKFGWYIVEDETKINIYDFYKNKLILLIVLIASFFIIILSSDDTSMIFNYFIYLLILLFIYVAFSFGLIKKHLSLLYFLFGVLPMIYLYVCMLKIVNGSSDLMFVFTLFYLITSIKFFFFPKKKYKKDNYSKMNDPNKYNLLILAFVTIMMRKNEGMMLFLVFILVNSIVLYTYKEIKYVLKNSEEYNKGNTKLKWYQ